MTLYMLDTNAAIAAIRGNAQIDQKLTQLDASQWCLSAVTYSELRFGLALLPQASKLARLVECFLEVASIEPWHRGAAEVHGRLRASLRLSDTPIGDFHEMIAAHALALNAILAPTIPGILSVFRGLYLKTAREPRQENLSGSALRRRSANRQTLNPQGRLPNTHRHALPILAADANTRV
jgi:tRNA(fMet)-specific endonuclease VapC